MQAVTVVHCHWRYQRQQFDRKQLRVGESAGICHLDRHRVVANRLARRRPAQIGACQHHAGGTGDQSQGQRVAGIGVCGVERPGKRGADSHRGIGLRRQSRRLVYVGDRHGEGPGRRLGVTIRNSRGEMVDPELCQRRRPVDQRCGAERGIGRSRWQSEGQRLIDIRRRRLQQLLESGAKRNRPIGDRRQLRTGAKRSVDGNL